MVHTNLNLTLQIRPRLPAFATDVSFMTLWCTRAQETAIAYERTGCLEHKHKPQKNKPSDSYIFWFDVVEPKLLLKCLLMYFEKGCRHS